MHPAHALKPGDTRFAAGTSAVFVTGQAREAIDDAQLAVPRVAGVPDPSYGRGALALAAISPGLAPYVAARVGVLPHTEAGLSYSGRTARIDGRYALENSRWAASAGLGASALLHERSDVASEQLSGLDLSELNAWGLDVPILVGWRSRADVAWVWAGARGGYEKLGGKATVLAADNLAMTGEVDASRLYALGVAGLGLGFRHLHAGLELQAGYQCARGSFWGTSHSVEAFSLSPAAALIGSF